MLSVKRIPAKYIKNTKCIQLGNTQNREPLKVDQEYTMNSVGCGARRHQWRWQVVQICCLIPWPHNAP